MNMLRPEDELLICIARRYVEKGVVDRLRRLTQQNIDWEYVLKAATLHGLSPLLATHLVAVVPDRIPEPILQQLKAGQLEGMKGSVYLVHELMRVLKLLDTKNIPVLVFKGPILAQMIYGDVGLRQAGDLDLLIAKRDFSRVKDLLQSNGYLMEPQLSDAQQRAHLDFHCEIQFCNADQFSVVDLHWGLTPRNFPFVLSFEDLWSRRQTILVAGRQVDTFSTEDLLLYLCVHGAKHYWIRLEWIAAVAELITHHQIADWTKLFRLAETTNSQKMLTLGLILARDLFELELPAQAKTLLSESEVLRKTAQRLEKHLFEEAGTSPSQVEAFRWNFKFMDRRRDAFESFVRSVFMPTISDWQRVQLPDAVYPLYYGTRPLALLSKYGKRLTNGNRDK